MGGWALSCDRAARSHGHATGPLTRHATRNPNIFTSKNIGGHRAAQDVRARALQHQHQEGGGRHQEPACRSVRHSVSVRGRPCICVSVYLCIFVCHSSTLVHVSLCVCVGPGGIHTKSYHDSTIRSTATAAHPLPLKTTNNKRNDRTR